MVIEIVPRLGGAPLRLDASQIIIFDDNGNAVGVAGEFAGNSIKISHAADADFNHTLQAFGFGRHRVMTSVLPAGASLIRS